VIDAYTLTLAALLIASGSTADRIGRPRTFQIGLASFTVGSLLCSLAPNLLLLIVARIVQAVGGSMLNPVAMSIITNVFTAPAERARAIGVWGGVARFLATAGRPGGVAHGADDDDLRSDIRPVGGDRPRQDGPGGRRRRDDRRRGRIDADVGRQPADWSAPRWAVAVIGSVLAGAVAAGPGAAGTLVTGILAGAATAWWIVAGCGIAVPAIGVPTTGAWARATVARTAALMRSDEEVRSIR